MQSRRWEHLGSSGELDVFGATNYFAGGLPAPDDVCRRPSSATEPPADRLYFQAAKVVQRDMMTMTVGDNSFRGPHQQQQPPGVHGHAERHATNKQLMQVVAAKRLPSGKSRLAALLSFMVSPSPRASFRKEIINKDAPSMTTTRRRQTEAAAAAAGVKSRETDKESNSNSPSSSSRESSSMQLQAGLFGAHDDDELVDLGVATGDRRLQGITVVRGGGSSQERWVVRCVPGGAWDDDEERREKMVDVDAAESKMLDAAESAASSEQNIKDEMAEVEQAHGDDNGNTDPPAHSHSWDSDSSSDLFDLDLEY